MSKLIKRNTETCKCSAYPFPHRRHSGKCESCRHNKNFKGVYFFVDLQMGEWCETCARDEIESNGGNWNEFLLSQFI